MIYAAENLTSFTLDLTAGFCVEAARIMSEKNYRKTLCKIDGLCSVCDGFLNGLSFEKMRDSCDACVKSTYFDRCMHCFNDGRCDSVRARDMAEQNKGKTMMSITK